MIVVVTVPGSGIGAGVFWVKTAVVSVQPGGAAGTTPSVCATADEAAKNELECETGQETGDPGS